MQAALVPLQRAQAGWADGVRATRICHRPTHHTSPRDPRGAWGRNGPLASPSQSSPASSVGDFSGAPLRKAQPLDRSVLAAGFGRRKVGEARRREGEGGGRREERGGFRGRSSKWQAAFPPQSVELERGGARRRLRHQTPGAPRCSEPPPP